MNALKLPMNYVEVDRNEMEYIDGGSVSLPMSSSYLSKSYCLDVAGTLFRYQAVKNMTSNEIAQELYAHAYLYYYGVPASIGLGLYPVASYIAQHADPIDIQDGGDTAVRKAVFSFIWLL